MADARTTMQSEDARERSEATTYVIDPHAVAEAILCRLVAGRTLPPPPRAGTS